MEKSRGQGGGIKRTRPTGDDDAEEEERRDRKARLVAMLSEGVPHVPGYLTSESVFEFFLMFKPNELWDVEETLAQSTRAAGLKSREETQREMNMIWRRLADYHFQSPFNYGYYDRMDDEAASALSPEEGETLDWAFPRRTSTRYPVLDNFMALWTRVENDAEARVALGPTARNKFWRKAFFYCALATRFALAMYEIMQILLKVREAERFDTQLTPTGEDAMIAGAGVTPDEIGEWYNGSTEIAGYGWRPNAVHDARSGSGHAAFIPEHGAAGQPYPREIEMDPSYDASPVDRSLRGYEFRLMSEVAKRNISTNTRRQVVYQHGVSIMPRFHPRTIQLGYAPAILRILRGDGIMADQQLEYDGNGEEGLIPVLSRPWRTTLHYGTLAETMAVLSKWQSSEKIDPRAPPQLPPPSSTTMVAHTFPMVSVTPAENDGATFGTGPRNFYLQYTATTVENLGERIMRMDNVAEWPMRGRVFAAVDRYIVNMLNFPYLRETEEVTPSPGFALRARHAATLLRRVELGDISQINQRETMFLRPTRAVDPFVFLHWLRATILSAEHKSIGRPVGDSQDTYWERISHAAEKMTLTNVLRVPVKHQMNEGPGQTDFLFFLPFFLGHPDPAVIAELQMYILREMNEDGPFGASSGTDRFLKGPGGRRVQFRDPAFPSGDD